MGTSGPSNYSRKGPNSSTPKDLALWRAIPQMLHQRLAGGVQQEDNDDDAENDAIPTVEQLRTWCLRSHQLLQEYEWLNHFATPVE